MEILPPPRRPHRPGRIDVATSEPAVTQGWDGVVGVGRHGLQQMQQMQAQNPQFVRVRVYPRSDAEGLGVIVEDFGELAGQAVDLGGIHIDPARRWAVQLDTGALVFVNTDHLVLTEPLGSTGAVNP